MLDTHKIKTFCEQYENAAYYLQRELEIWGDALCQPVVSSLTIHMSLGTLEPHDLTALIRTLAKTHRVLPAEQRHHAINCHHLDLSDNWLGLFRGLGFNICLMEMNLTALQKTEAVIQKLQHILEFGFSQTGIVISPAASIDELKPAVLPLLKRFAKLHIFLGHTSHDALDTSFELEPNEDTKININLGPGQDAQIHNNYAHKFHDMAKYTLALQNNELPINPSFFHASASLF